MLLLTNKSISEYVMAVSMQISFKTILFPHDVKYHLNHNSLLLLLYRLLQLSLTELCRYTVKTRVRYM